MWVHVFSKKFQHIWVSLNVNFNESLTNDVVSFEQLGPAILFGCYGNKVLKQKPFKAQSGFLWNNVGVFLWQASTIFFLILLLLPLQ